MKNQLTAGKPLKKFLQLCHICDSIEYMNDVRFVQCTVRKGMFDDEVGVEVSVGQQRIALFVSKQSVTENRAGRHFLRVRRVGKGVVALPSEPMGSGGRYLRIPDSSVCLTAQ